MRTKLSKSNQVVACSAFPGFVLAVLLTTGVVDTAAAQSIFGRITGTVTDSQGGAVAGVKIIIVNEETKLERQTTTDSNGYYVASDLPVGVYSVIAEQSGFKTLKKTGNDLVAGARMSVDLSLMVGEVSQKVEVAATVETINTTSGELARVIDSNQVRTVALNARNYMQLLSLTPGTALTVDDQLSLTTSLAINNQSVNGNRPDSNALSVDGGFNMDSGSNSSQVNNVGIDFIREVAIKSSNFSAEYGRNSGASVNVVTRSGSNSYHGAVFEYLRNEKLDARNPAPGARKTPLRFNDFGWDFGGPIKRGKLFFFAGEEWKRIRLTATPQTRTVPTAAELSGDFSALLALPTPVQLHRPGSTTPIQGNRLDQDPNTPLTTDGIAIAKIYSTMTALASGLTPFPVGSANPVALTATFQPNNPFNWRQDIVRLDYHLNGKHDLYGRYLHDNFDLVDGFGTFVDAGVLPTTPTHRLRPGYGIQLGEVWLVTPNIVNQAKINASWNGQRIPPAGVNWQRATYGFAFPQLFPGGRFPDGIPDISILSGGGTPGISGTQGPDFSLLSPTVDIAPADDITWQKGPHTFKAGVLVVRNRKDQNGRSRYNGQITFSNSASNANTTGNALADALLGNFQSYAEASDDPIGHFRFTDVEAYVYDSWKVARRFSLEFGLRYQHAGPTYTQANNIVSFDPSLFDPLQAVTLTANGNSIDTTKGGNRLNGLVRAGDGVPADQLVRVPNGNSPSVLAVPAGAPRGFYDVEHLFAPRFGFSYSPFKDDRTAIRGGIGLFYDKPEGNIIFSQLNLPPFIQSSTFQNGNLSNPSGGAAGAASLLGASAINPHLKVARTTSYSLGVQREMPWGVLLEASYVGNEQRHILRQPDINLPTFAQIQANAALPAPLPLNRLRPYQGYTSIRMYLSDSTANYNAFQVYATKRKGDFMATVSYTWSKTLADSSGLGANPDNWRDRRYNYGVADFDRRHVFATTYFYDVPFLRNRGGFIGTALGGWQLSGITRAQSGPPITILANFSLAGTPVNGRRADRVPGVSLAPTAPGQWFNPAAFANPSPISPGTSGVGTFTGPYVFVTDLSLRKYFKLPRENMNLMFQSDFFNIFNRANYSLGSLGNATLTVGSSNFGGFGSASNPRNVQFGLKFNF
ncbi:MAG TPA: carboxypeptidase-like regulatory domain-containing protein [Terriglobia bacterium]|nr:carboxypeptidase-like regulatory domain-containing protein [Terriglobia bacterium]